MNFGPNISACNQICSTLAPLFSDQNECLEQRPKVEEKQLNFKKIIMQNRQRDKNSVDSNQKIQDVIKVEANVTIIAGNTESIPSSKRMRKELSPEALAAKRAKDAERQRRRRAKLFGEAVAAEKAMNTVTVMSGETESLTGYRYIPATDVNLDAAQANQFIENFTIEERGFSNSDIKLETQDELDYADQTPSCSTEVNSGEQLSRSSFASAEGTHRWREKCCGAEIAAERKNRNDSLQECSSTGLNAIDFGDIFAQIGMKEKIKLEIKGTIFDESIQDQDHTSLATLKYLKSAEALAVERAKNAERQRRRRAKLKGEALALERFKNAERARKRRSAMTEEERAAIRARDAERQRQRRASLTEEEIAMIRAKNANKTRFRRSQFSEDEKAKLRKKYAGSMRERRSLLSDEDRIKRRAKDTERMRDRRLLLSEEEKAVQRAKNAERQRMGRSQSEQFNGGHEDFLSYCKIEPAMSLSPSDFLLSSNSSCTMDNSASNSSFSQTPQLANSLDSNPDEQSALNIFPDLDNILNSASWDQYLQNDF
ncbi:hypothetical protein DdX_02768 [Ditylenchus destructor]|uniref:Uncharacterized protein n=1 Tax=Ditylenchus destructor TaxID=166010 RepID=A0AAD4NF00_9BILA|nr:hypothetical protein DdX_02768 [Ditylenchus destructor]